MPLVLNDPATPAGPVTLADLLDVGEVTTEADGWVRPCPAHADARPSLRVSWNEETRKVGLHCRAGCATNDVLAALSLTMSQLFDVERGDLGDLQLRTTTERTADLTIGDRAALRQYLDRAAAALDNDESAAALAYVTERFGLSEEQVRELGLGYDDGTLDGGRLVLSRRAFHNSARLVVPFLNFDGRPHGLQARALDAGAEPRWSGPVNPETSSWGTYGVLRSAGSRPEVIVTEGPSDALTAGAAGYDVVFVRGAALGSSRSLADQVAEGLRDRPVLVAGDNDAAGAKFTRQVLDALTARGVDARAMTIPTGANDITAWREAEGENFPAALSEAVTQSLSAPDTSTEEGKGADGEPTVTRTAIVSYARREYSFFRSEDGTPYAKRNSGARLAMEIGDKLKRDLMYEYSSDRERRTGKLVIVRDEMMRSVMQYLVAEAERSDTVEDVALRAALVDDGRRVVVDLGGATGRVVSATADGWEVRDSQDGDPYFRRTRPTLPLPEPVPGGSLDVLRELLGFEEREARWLLVRGWLAVVFFADYDRPLLWLTGSQGSGKTTRAKMVLNLVNPAENLGKEPGKKEWDDSSAAMARFVVAYDNLTTISQAVSDWLCRLVTGVSEDRRVLYSQDEVHTVSFKRAGIATSITMPPGLASDAMERISTVHLDRVPDGGRRSAEMILAAYEAARPELLGAVLDDVVRVLQQLDRVRADDTRQWPRMADFGIALAALDEALGVHAGTGHLAAYTGAVHDEMTERALDDEFTVAVIGLVNKRPAGEWRGTATDLLVALDRVAGWDWTQNKRPEWWPTSPRRLKDQLKRHAESLHHAGVQFLEPPRRGSAREVVLRRLGDLTVVPDVAAPSNVIAMPA